MTVCLLFDVVLKLTGLGAVCGESAVMAWLPLPLLLDREGAFTIWISGDDLGEFDSVIDGRLNHTATKSCCRVELRKSLKKESFSELLHSSTNGWHRGRVVISAEVGQTELQHTHYFHRQLVGQREAYASNVMVSYFLVKKRNLFHIIGIVQ